MRGLRPWEHLSLLAGLQGEHGWPAWDNDDLDAVLAQIGNEGAALWAAVPPRRSTFDLGLLWYALERLEGTPDPERFFAACGRVQRRRPDLPSVEIQAGEFPMGSPEGEGEERERPRHLVRITRPFRLGTTTVTRAQYRAFDPQHRCPGEDQHPVTEVDWFSARLFAAWVGGRLPTEAEWECACRGGPGGPWSCEGATLGEYAWFGEGWSGKAHAVAGKHANPLGLFDMQGNVWEWTACRWLRPYGADPVDDPVGPERGPRRVVRGGSWWNSAGGCRSAYRYRGHPRSRGRGLGFRVAWSPSRG
ncbi:MAG: SUMF1/EgtB/PvdO family nonheme iron enzyme [Pseudomonadota bacterium]